MRRSAKLGCLVALSLCFSVYLVEVLLSAASQSTDEIAMRAARDQGLPFDARPKIEVVEDLARSGADVHPLVLPRNILASDGIRVDGATLFPLASIANGTTVYCNDGGTFPLFSSDEHGFNNPAGIWSERPPEVVLIGDSFAQGWCVEKGEDVGSRLRRHGLRVINLGIGGHGPLLELATLVEYAPALTPRIVLWLYYEGNDFVDLATEWRRSKLLKRYLEPDFSQGLVDRQPEVDRAWLLNLERQLRRRGREVDGAAEPASRARRFARAFHGIVTLQSLRSRLEGVRRPDPGPREQLTPLFREILQRADELVSSWQGRLLFVYLPEIRVPALAQIDENTYYDRQRVLAIVRELEIPVIDFAQVMHDHPDPLSIVPFRLGGHFNARGYELLAQTVHADLERYMPPDLPR